MTDAAALDYLRATDLAKLAQITPCFEVYCKACDRWLAYKPHRGEAWLAFARHVALHHTDGTPLIEGLVIPAEMLTEEDPDAQ